MNTFQQILIKYWGHSSFRPLQEDVIQAVFNNKDTLALMPTGGGKSITFQVPALAKDGICLVITPLIALMKDQVENLKKREIRAIAIYSGMTRAEIDIALDNCIYGNYKFLYLSPERLSTEIFLERLKRMNVNLIAVDEAHCISQWGYDFRPAYLKIAEIRHIIPDAPVLALTATATPDVVDDIQEKLSFKTKYTLKKSFERKNLVYLVRHVENKLGYLLKICSKTTGSGIIYVRNRKKTREIATFLKNNGFRADYYHAGLSNEERNRKQDEWKSNKTRIIASTNAFGMGIDKPDVRFVAHLDLPDTLEAYFQEAGRAGRDEKKAYAIMLYNNGDKASTRQRALVNFPEIELIKKVYQSLGSFLQVPYGGGKLQEYDFHLAPFCQQYRFNPITAYNCLKILETEGLIEVTEEINKPSKIIFLVNRDDLYKFQVENASFDGFIKLVLRTYSGIFSEYASIDEQFLANKSGLSYDTVYNYLKKLSAQKIIHYIPKRNTPLIVFTEERLDEKSLRINRSALAARKERYLKRLEAVLEYCTNDHKCRSQQLLQYFGEKDVYRCGKCDVCQKRNELHLSRYEFDLILKNIKEALDKSPLLMNELVKKAADKEDKALNVIQYLLDNEKIIRQDDDKYTWHSSSKD